MNRLLVLVSAVIALAACNNDSDDCLNTREDNDVIQLSAYLADVKPADTRTVISNTGTASWADNDAIGVFCPQAKFNADNVSYTVTGLSSTPVWTANPKIYWADGTTVHTFLGYAPYAAGNSSSASVKLPALTPQTGTISPSQDFLISNNLGTTGVKRTDGTGLVALTFTHAFALIELQTTIDASVAAGTTLQSCMLTGIAADKPFSTDATSTINLSTNAIVTGAASNTLTVTPTTAPVLSTTSTSIFIIVLPGSWTPTFTFKVNESGGGAITIPTAIQGVTNYQAGQKYVYTVAISRTAINISTPTITDWNPVPSGTINGGI